MPEPASIRGGVARTRRWESRRYHMVLTLTMQLREAAAPTTSSVA
jgi:hypothetical protein